MSLCTICEIRAAAPPRRRYCGSVCAKEAIRRWKQDVRDATRKLWLAGLSTDPPWMDGWKTLDERRAYYREYMRKRRRAQRAARGRENSTRITGSPCLSTLPESPEGVIESGPRASCNQSH